MLAVTADTELEPLAYEFGYVGVSEMQGIEVELTRQSALGFTISWNCGKPGNEMLWVLEPDAQYA